MKIINKKRFILSLTVLILVIISIFKLSFAEIKVQTENYTVAAGDTLWSIACENATGDVREYVYNLRQINNLEDCIIYPGQVIQIIK